MKLLKFDALQSELMISGVKWTTWRVGDEKQLEVGDEVLCINKDTDEAFGMANITAVRKKTFATLTAEDRDGHETFVAEADMYEIYRRYYGCIIGPETLVTVAHFTFKPKVFAPITVVDEQDNVIGEIGLREAKHKGCIRRIARVLVFSESGELLLQQRSQQVMDPGLWDFSAAGHVDAGESYHTTAARELAEELGLAAVELEELATSVRTLDCMDGVYRVVVPDDTDFNFDPEEVTQVAWWSAADLQDMMANEPEQFSAYFRQLWPRIEREWWLR